MEDNTEQTNSPPTFNLKIEVVAAEPPPSRAVKPARMSMLLAFVAFGLPYVADEGLSQSARDRDRKEKGGKEIGSDATPPLARKYSTAPRRL